LGNHLYIINHTYIITDVVDDAQILSLVHPQTIISYLYIMDVLYIAERLLYVRFW